MSPALDADGNVRDGAVLAELTGVLSLTGWPPEQDLARLRQPRLRDHRLLKMLAMTDHEALRWEPKRVRHRLFHDTFRISRPRRAALHLAAGSPLTELLLPRSPDYGHSPAAAG